MSWTMLWFLGGSGQTVCKDLQGLKNGQNGEGTVRTLKF
jgi:hypothetical protein